MKRKYRRRHRRPAVKSKVPWRYHSLISFIPLRHRTVLAIILLMMVVSVYVYWSVKYSDKVAEFIGAALVEHVLFGE